MFSITGILLCVGALTAPNATCDPYDDTVGPFKTQVSCLARLNEIKQTWPGVYARQHGAAVTTIFTPKSLCVQPDDLDGKDA